MDTPTTSDLEQIALQLTGHARAAADVRRRADQLSKDSGPRALSDVVLREAGGRLSATIEGTVRRVRNHARLVRALYERLDRPRAAATPPVCPRATYGRGSDRFDTFSFPACVSSLSRVWTSRWDRERQVNENVARAEELRAQGRVREAQEFADRAIAAAEAIVAQDPADAQARWVLAGQLYNRASLHSELNDYAAGAADAWRSLTLYEPLAVKSPQHLPTCTDARARLAWMLANADLANTNMGSARDHAAQAVATYERLVADTPALRPDLARVHYLHAEVLRVLEGEGSPASVAAYAACVREYQSLGPLTGNSLRLCADGALRLAYGYAANGAHTDQRDAAQEAMDRLEELLNQGVGAHAHYARAILLLSDAQAALGDPQWEQSWVDFEYVLSRLPAPLPADLAPFKEQLKPR